MERKGLAVIYDPHNLYQFVWYYCNKGKEKKWDALCLPNGSRGEYMHEFCEKAGIFEKIFSYNTSYESLSTWRKAKLFLSMLWYFLLKKQEVLCKRLVNQYVRLDDYDEIVVLADVGMISGACVALGQEKNVIILEDGTGDFRERVKKMQRDKLKSLYNWQGFFMSKMGYCSPGWFFFEPDKYCIKYSSQPEKMKYKNYKEIRLLYEDDGTDWKVFFEIVKRVYPMVDTIDFDNAEVMLLTRPLEDFVDHSEKYEERLEDYISSKYSNVLIKKHPRENGQYSFEQGVVVDEIHNSIPAEVILPYLKGKEIVIVSTSAIMLYLKSFGLQSKVIMFDDMYEESRNSNSQFRAMSLAEAEEFGKEFAEGCYEMVVL